MKSVCFTGYRPEKYPFSENSELFTEMKACLYRVIKTAIDSGFMRFYTGMARGFDILAAEIVLSLKNYLNKPEIELICVIPFQGHDNNYEPEWAERHEECLKKANGIVCVQKKASKYAYLMRNDYLIENSELVIAFYDGKPGGTKYTVLKAVKEGIKIINIANEMLYTIITIND